ncbi:hypothetical protein BUALT_Bualt12G0135700 [Buddleja alternifolia]|uniref:Uncharacterized protein n=1 Tax=Buddleja alternifolia TaxID=168488 RepID=A0AAV6WXX1_9LAMI|nr:hypothetical protein BUALT_Bualt12G0135700 [Buddleja alternifolia]
MSVIKGSESYNCQVLCLNRNVVMIRQKIWLANDGNYKELRWFIAWKQKEHLEDFLLSSRISEALSQTKVPFGYGYIQFRDTNVIIFHTQQKRRDCLKELLLDDWTDIILCSFCMPVIKGSEYYNCQVLCLNRKVVMIHQKMCLENDGNYREPRWFTAWKQKEHLEDFLLFEALSQTTVPFGYGYIQFLDMYVIIS